MMVKMMKSPYELDQLLGLDYFVTDTPGIGGRLRTTVEDFVVNELCEDPEESKEALEGEYTHFTLQKRNWDTHRAIKFIGKRLGVSHKRFGFAGTKDKRAVTSQRVAIWNVDQETLERIDIRDITLSNFNRSDRRISLGDSLGNGFEIAVRGVENEELQASLEGTAAGLKECGVPNYFGYQRFGVVRPNTHLVGREILNGDLESAVLSYLGKPYESEREDVYEARKFVDDTKDFKKALEIFPRRLNYERSMLDALSKNPNDFAGALRRLPKKLRWMLVHAYQSHLFNIVLSRCMEEGMDVDKIDKIPLFGYESSFSTGRLGEIEKSVIERSGVSFDQFKIPSMPELGSRGFLRDAFIKIDPDFEITGDELSDGKNVLIKFSLPTGSYATVVMREFMKADPLNY
jgi:tRNA pseudouridine13 synthase